MKVSEIRDLIITGTYMIGEGMIEPPNWKDYANKLEETLAKNNGVLPGVDVKLIKYCNVDCLEKRQLLAEQNTILVYENEKLRQRLAEAVSQPLVEQNAHLKAENERLRQHIAETGWQPVATQNTHPKAENVKSRERLVNAGLENEAIQTDSSKRVGKFLLAFGANRLWRK